VAALEGLGLPAATLDAQGRLLTVNAGFEKRLGTIFEQGPRRLHMCEKASDLLLSAAFQQLRLTNSGTAIPTGRAGEGALHLLPIRGEALDLFSRAASLALLVEPREQPLPSVELLTIVFGLTRGEAETARAIASGASIATVAAGRGVSPETIRSQLKSVFQKTYTNRQSELAALLNRLGGTAKPLAI
jgi:DNA-binding CsgD family transcriptional regulator